MNGVQLGAEFLRSNGTVPVELEGNGTDPGDQLLMEIRAALLALPRVIERAVAAQPRPHNTITYLPPPAQPQPPQVLLSDPDLSDIVTAVNGLKPGASADDIGRAVARHLNPQASGDNAMVDAMQQLIEKIDFRLQGVGRAFGSSGPSNISDNPNRELGIVTVSGLTTVGTTTVAAPITNQATWTSGSAVQMTASSDPVTNGILVRGLKANTSPVYVGANGVTTSTGFELAPGESTSFTCANANLIYFIGTHSGDGVCFSVL